MVGNAVKMFSLMALFSSVVLPSVYLIDQKVTFFRIFGTMAFLFFLIDIFTGKKGAVLPSTKRIMRWAFTLIFTKLIIDLAFHFEGIVEPFNAFLKESLTVLMLPVFERIDFKKMGIEKTLFVCSILPLALGMAQIFDGNVTMEKVAVLPYVGFYGGSEFATQWFEKTERIVGTWNISIGFAILLGFLIILAFFEYLDKMRSFFLLGFLVVLFLLMLGTQTRSGIYGVIPSILLGYLVVKKSSIKAWIVCGVVSLTLVACFSFIQRVITDYSARSRIEMDVNTYAKITANIYGSYSVLKSSPLIGVSHADQRKMITKGKRALGRVVETEEEYGLFQTHHNLFGRYFQYYGFVGLSLLLMLVWAMMKKVGLKRDVKTRMKLTGLLIFFLQFAMLHNNALLLSPLLWMLLAMGEEKGRSGVKNKGFGDRHRMRVFDSGVDVEIVKTRFWRA